MPPASRCFGDGDPLYERYHDVEWGRPVTDERGLFEHISLEAFQSGLSWRIVLGKRDGMRAAFAGFDPDAVARFGEDDVQRLLDDPAVIRNRRKIEAVIVNAGATIRLRDSGGLVTVMWSHATGDRSAPAATSEIRAATEASVALTRDLKRNGFAFVGPTTVYASMQACGVVNDHLDSCPARAAAEADRNQALRIMGL